MSSNQKLKAYKNIFSEIEKKINEEDWNTEDGDIINRKLVPFWQRFVHSILMKEGRCGCISPDSQKQCFLDLDTSDQLNSRAWGDGDFVSFDTFKREIRFMWRNVKKYEVEPSS